MRKGFTLAEVLITLGIIGIVTAMTIPMLIGKYKKEVTVNKLKKAYSAVNQAILLSVAQNGDYKDWENPEIIGASNYFSKYWLPYLKGAIICDRIKCDYYGKGGLKTDSGFKTLNNGYSGVDPIYQGRSTLLLPDGSVLIFFVHYTASFTGKNHWLYIDINGANLPNTYGKDVFLFERNEAGAVVPRCKDSTKSAIDSDCSASGTGSCCAAKIILDGWKIKNDYPFD